MANEPIRVKIKTDWIDSHDLNRQRYVEESTKIIDHANPSDRKWLSLHCFWAARNGRRVTIIPIY